MNSKIFLCKLSIKNLLVLTLLLFLFITSQVLCLFAGVGTAGTDFLKISPGVRPTAMGNAFVGLANDINAINYNPAGLGPMSGGEMMFTHNQWFEEIKIEHIAFRQKIGDSKNIGVAGTFLSSGEIKKFNNVGDELGTTYSVADTLLLVSYSMWDTESDISIGCNVKYIGQRIEQEQATGFGLDLGVLYHPLSIGFVIQNIGTPMKFISESKSLPVNIILGGAGGIRDLLNIAVDARFYSDGQSSIGIGVEYILKNVAVRAGYDTLYSGLGGLAGFSAGLGVDVGPTKIDFAWIPHSEDLGETYRVAMTLLWGD